MALDTAARRLSILGLLQSRPEWSGRELAERFDVTTRTVRNDIEALRALDYPVHATRGAAGAYRLGAGGRMPPLMLDDDEAVAVAVGLRTAAGLAGVEAAGRRALVKLEQVLPARLRASVDALGQAVERAPENTGTDAPDPEVDPAVLRQLATAIGDAERVRFESGGRAWAVEPYRLLSWQRRWYLVGRIAESGAWDVWRVDGLEPKPPTRRRFEPVVVASDELTAFMMRRVATTGWNVHARLRIAASAQSVLDRINPAVGAVEAVSATECVLVTGADSLDTIAAYIGMLNMDFTVDSPAELVPLLRTIGERYLRVAAAAAAAAAPGGH
ncbi:YafY family protein [Agromyces sp. LHK192]|uniref:helix-turn-helix transcriptional regulator n=1 Tax=Agromyces sp. LHK192 TaxID=2498704 RepID=UPI000FDAA684|nr:WYL domain-containing protein [Agromyces sp. LHK192]